MECWLLVMVVVVSGIVPEGVVGLEPSLLLLDTGVVVLL